ncbi:hypothetical protein Tco_0883119 [Tanacetum coccineum]
MEKPHNNKQKWVKDETVTKEWEDRMERAATTASSLEVEQDNDAQTRFEATSKKSNDPHLSRVNTLGSGEDSMNLKELMELYTKLSERVLDLVHNLMLPVQVNAAEGVFINTSIQMDKKKVIITETSIRRDLHLEDAEGTDCLPIATIFEELERIGYEKPSQKLTFYKAFFSPQWKFLIHTILQCLSAKSTAWNEFSSTMASAIICLTINQKFNLSKYIFDNMLGDMSHHKKIYVTPSHIKKFFANMKREGKDFSRRVTPLFATILVSHQEEMSEGLDIPTDPQHTPTTTQTTSEHVTTTSNDPLLSEKIAGSRTTKLKRLYKVGATRRVEFSDDEGLGAQEDASKQGRSIEDIDKDAKVTLVDETQEGNDDLMFNTGDLDGEEVVVVEQSEKVIEEMDNAAQTISTANVTVTAASGVIPSSKTKVKDVVKEPSVPVSATTIMLSTATTIVVTIPTITAQPQQRAKGIAFREPIESTVTTTVPSQKSKDKGKAIITEPEVPLKKKDQLRIDEELARKLEAKEQEAARLEREKAEKLEKSQLSSY